MRFFVRSTCTFASRASANMLRPMTIAATAITPMMEDQKRRRMSVRLPLIDDNRVQEQPEPHERREEDQVAQADHAAGEILKTIDHRKAACDLCQYRRIAR